MISVIIPIYNSAQYLPACLESVLNQTYRDLEVICINDGSTDGSLQILQQLARQDSRLRVIDQKNSGASAARNTGLDLARGEFVAFVDSDDTLEADMYETLLSLQEAHQADIAHCGYKRIRMDGSVKEVSGTGLLLVQNWTEAIPCLLTGTYFACGLWNKLYRRSLFDQVRFDTNLKINEDMLVNVQVFHKAGTTVFLDAPLYCYYERSQSICNATAELRKLKDSIYAAQWILQAHANGPIQGVCAEHLLRRHIALYRHHLMNGLKPGSPAFHQIHRKITDIQQAYRAMSPRNLLNYRFMRYLPRIYRLVYRVYDRLRTPNWDVKEG